MSNSSTECGTRSYSSTECGTRSYRVWHPLIQQHRVWHPLIQQHRVWQGSATWRPAEAKQHRTWCDDKGRVVHLQPRWAGGASAATMGRWCVCSHDGRVVLSCCRLAAVSPASIHVPWWRLALRSNLHAKQAVLWVVYADRARRAGP